MLRTMFYTQGIKVIFVPEWPDEFKYRSLGNPEIGYSVDAEFSRKQPYDTRASWEAKMQQVAAERAAVKVEVHPLRKAVRQGTLAGVVEAAKIASATQVGGTHYSKLAIQPMEYSVRNNLDPLQHTIIKYATRHKDKGGAEDIKKIIHTAQLILEMQYGEGQKDEVQE